MDVRPGRWACSFEQTGSLSPLPSQRRRANIATFKESQHVEKCVHISLSPKKVKFCIVCVVYERLRVFWLSARFFQVLRRWCAFAAKLRMLFPVCGGILSTVADPQSHKHFHVSSVKVSACAKDCRVATIADSIGSMVENVRANGVVVCVTTSFQIIFGGLPNPVRKC